MDTLSATEATAAPRRTTLERTSERETVVTGVVNGSPDAVFEAWITPALLMRWWMPDIVGMPLVACETDPRVGGTYRFTFQVDPTTTVVYFGRYVEVSPPSRLVWTNEEAGEANAVVTTVTFEEAAPGRTRLRVLERYPSGEFLDAAIASGQTAGDMAEQFDQLEALLAGLR